METDIIMIKRLIVNFAICFLLSNTFALQSCSMGKELIGQWFIISYSGGVPNVPPSVNFDRRGSGNYLGERFNWSYKTETLTWNKFIDYSGQSDSLREDKKFSLKYEYNDSSRVKTYTLTNTKNPHDYLVLKQISH